MRIKVGEAKKAVVQKEAPMVNGITLAQEFEELRTIIQKAYEEPTTMSDAETLAARFLHAQMLVAEELQKIDLDTRMRKNGLKAKKAEIWYAAATSEEKKPSDKQLDSLVDKDPSVQALANDYEGKESYRESLSVYLGIFRDGHIYFRGLARGAYGQ